MIRKYHSHTQGTNTRRRENIKKNRAFTVTRNQGDNQGYREY